MMLSSSVEGFCPLEDQQTQQRIQDQNVFYKCIRRMAEADENQDDWLDRHKFTRFLQKLAWSLYLIPPSFVVVNGTTTTTSSSTSTLPLQEETRLFEMLVHVTGGEMDENGVPMMDVWGSRMEDVSYLLHTCRPCQCHECR